MIGNLLDQRYQVVKVLGQGGFGHTYIAKDTRRPGNPTCVVKLLRPAISDPDFLQIARRLFNSEAETLEKLGNHDQIPRLLAYFEEQEEFYLVQEFIDGHPLSAELAPGQRWSESQVIQFLQEVLSILEFVHGNGVIHRDLKPDNLIRRSVDNKLVLVDFGAVKQVKMQSLVALEPIKALEPIEQTVAIGTPGYMPSEQGQGRPRPSSDIYALGMIGIQALTGLNPMHLAEDIETGEIIWRHQAQVSDNLAFILDKMVRHYFKHRYQSATEALQALDSLTNPSTPKDWAMALSQKGRAYFNNGYQSANNAVRSLQGLAKSYLPTNPPNSLPAQTVTIAPDQPSSSPVGWQPLLASVTKFSPKAPVLIGAGTATVAMALTISAIRQPSAPSASAIAQNPSNVPQNQTDREQNQPEIKSETPKPAEPTPILTQPETSQPNQAPSETPQPNQPTPNPAQSQPNGSNPELKDDCFVAIKASNLRSESGKRLGGVIKAGTKITVTGRQKDGWVEISAPESGWIWNSRIKNTCPQESKSSAKNQDSAKSKDAKKNKDSEKKSQE